MGLLEWIGEFFNPGPIGDIEGPGKEQDGQGQRESVVWVRFIIAMLLIGLMEFTFLTDDSLDAMGILRSNLGLLVYLLFAYLFRPRPNTDNLGWVPFLIDNPFRISDNFNRILVLLQLLLLPGRFVMQSIVALFRFRLRS